MSQESKKQTAVEWLTVELNSELNYIPITQWDRIRDLIQRAKKMEQQQIVNAVDGFPLENRHLDGEQYYTETYGKE
jgi:hypothetical protein